MAAFAKGNKETFVWLSKQTYSEKKTLLKEITSWYVIIFTIESLSALQNSIYIVCNCLRVKFRVIKYKICEAKYSQPDITQRPFILILIAVYDTLIQSNLIEINIYSQNLAVYTKFNFWYY